MSLSSMPDFSDIVKPVLEAGTYTNFGKTPKVFVVGKQNAFRRAKSHIRIENREPTYEQAFDGSIINTRLRGMVTISHSDNTKRNQLKADVANILIAGFSVKLPTGSDVPKVRNREESSFFVETLYC